LAGAVDVLAVGNINIDLAFYVDRAPAHDSEAFAHRFSRFHGGSAANFSVGAARLGLRSGILACVGNDTDGYEAVDTLRGEGVITEFIRRVEGAGNGAVCVIVEGDGSRRMLAFRGANASLEGIAAEGAEAATPGIVQLCNAGTDVLRSIMNAQGSWRVSVDPGGSVVDLERGGFGRSGHCLVKRERVRDPDQRGLAGGGQSALQERWHRGSQEGGAGSASAVCRGEFTLPAYRVDVQDTTGAGDAFDAAS
jgi:ribokinase